MKRSTFIVILLSILVNNSTVEIIGNYGLYKQYSTPVPAPVTSVTPATPPAEVATKHALAEWQDIDATDEWTYYSTRIDGCQYLYALGARGSLVHKGNCDNPIHGRQFWLQ
jgi:hypothetical protein